jgi:response regulator RpfG family c-di-GMP phosphodiesterase
MQSPTWLGERLKADGLITVAQYLAAVNAMGVHDERMEEALLRVGALDEVKLLRFVAEKTRTQYLSTSRLARIEVSSETLSKIPDRVAERMLVFPVHFDARSSELIVVSPDAGDPDLVKQITILTRARSLKPCIARPLAVKALVNKWYRGEIQAFAAIAPETFTQLENMDWGADARGRRSTAEPVPRERRITAEEPFARRSAVPAPNEGPRWTAPAPAGISTRAPAPTPAPVGYRPGAQPLTTLEPPPPPPAPPVQPRISPPPAPADSVRKLASNRLPSLRPVALEPEPREPRAVLDRRTADLIEMLHVLVALNENSRDEFRGHSAHVARISRRLAQRMGLDEAGGTYLAMAGNLHDLGKPVAYHLTLLNVHQYPTHRNAAQKLCNTPVRLLESIELPSLATAAVLNMYERFDGKGFPNGLARKEIPVAARVLSLCDAFSDLTLNPRNTFRRVLGPAEAVEALSQHRGTLFDPDIVDLLGQLVAGEDLKRRLGDDSPVVLLVEPEAEEATILELRLVSQGFQVELARTATQALAVAESRPLSFILSEVETEPFDGFELLARLRQSRHGADAPFLFVARTSNTETIERAFAQGAADYVVKPTSGDVLAAKLRRIGPPKSRAIAGIAGALSEMGVPDLAQILEQGRKSGNLKLRLSQGEGEIHFSGGRIVHAVFGALTGNEAFYALLTHNSGSFSLDPTFVPTTATIQGSAEGLILEGFRRLDEQNRDA